MIINVTHRSKSNGTLNNYHTLSNVLLSFPKTIFLTNNYVMSKVTKTQAMYKNFLAKVPTNSTFNVSKLCYTINVSMFSHI